MRKRKLARIQHWIACLASEVEPPVGPINLYNLLRVGYVYTISAEYEFPWSLPHLHMFARFFGGSDLAEFEIRVVWIDALKYPATSKLTAQFESHSDQGNQSGIQCFDCGMCRSSVLVDIA